MYARRGAQASAIVDHSTQDALGEVARGRELKRHRKSVKSDLRVYDKRRAACSVPTTGRGCGRLTSVHPLPRIDTARASLKEMQERHTERPQPPRAWGGRCLGEISCCSMKRVCVPVAAGPQGSKIDRSRHRASSCDLPVRRRIELPFWCIVVLLRFRVEEVEVDEC